MQIPLNCDPREYVINDCNREELEYFKKREHLSISIQQLHKVKLKHLSKKNILSLFHLMTLSYQIYSIYK